MGRRIGPALYPLGTGLKERPGKGKFLLLIIKRPDGVAASLTLEKPRCGVCHGKKRCRSRYKRQA